MGDTVGPLRRTATRLPSPAVVVAPPRRLGYPEEEEKSKMIPDGNRPLMAMGT